MPQSDDPSSLETIHGRQRVIIQAVVPEIEGGRYPAKRVMGETVTVEADIFADGHDVLSAAIRFRHTSEERWHEALMQYRDNDRWSGSFTVAQLGTYIYILEGWIDAFKTWRRDLQKKAGAGQDVTIELKGGALLANAAAARAPASERGMMTDWARQIIDEAVPLADRVCRALDPAVGAVLERHGDRELATRYGRELRVIVEPLRARYGAWYELFPRSAGSDGGRHGTFRDVVAALPRVAGMGFDVLYLPPIHPIGTAYRKGRNNAPAAQRDDPGSPWAIGAREGGHTTIHPQLGTLEDFRHLVNVARQHGIELALDLAFQCSPDHPYVRAHPEWFKRRPDGTIQYAENPPKKYQDIYPLDFETADWRSLWLELKRVVAFWISEGVSIFRVDNPHTKAFPFWEWVIGTLKADHPELIFLSEAFTRPKVMYHLAKVGFTQSYNYFPWRNTRRELEQFMTELTRSSVREFYRPNLWPNSPEILPQYLQFGGRAGFVVRLVLAATLGASYGIYGPAFELCDDEPRAPGEEEYQHSEKYELKAWTLDAPHTLEPLIAQVNRIRRENPALHSNDWLAFHEADNPDLIVYSKRTEDRANLILVVVNLDPHHAQRGFVRLNLPDLGIDPMDTFQVHELLSGSRYLWSTAQNFVELDPRHAPAAIFRLRRRIRSERDFDYFM